MDMALAFEMAESHRGDPLMVFDWDKAARILSDRMPDMAFAGLEGDYAYTGGIIWLSGEPWMRDYTYLASTWAKPLLIIGDEAIECWCHNPDWDAGTKWPLSAMEIVKKARKERR
jgi:hypothetical protein